jgi:hypothetical protein
MTGRIRSALRLCGILLALGVFLLALPRRAEAQLDLQSFTITANMNPVLGGDEVVLTADVVGLSQAPTGSVDFFLAGDASCSTKAKDLGTIGMYTPGQALFYSSSLPAGIDQICGTYIPDASSPYPGATTTSALVETVYANTAFSVSAPATAPPGQPITFSFTLTTPSGQPAPTGTITVTDYYNETDLGTSTIGAGGSAPSITGTDSSGHWDAVYSGDSIYASQTIYGSVLTVNALSVLSPGATAAGGPAVTVTFIGQGFTAASVAQIAGQNGQTLATTYVSPTRLRAVLPTSLIATPGTLPLQVQTGTTTTNVVAFVVGAPSADSVTAAATPASLTYGQFSAATFSATVKRGSVTDGAVPTGNATFSLTGPQNVSLGTAPLSQISAAGSYQPGTTALLDAASGNLTAADLNGDGIADLISIPQDTSGFTSALYLQVLLGNGVNGFQTQEQVAAGCYPQDFSVADMNGDGRPDIVVLCQESSGGPRRPAGPLSRKGPQPLQVFTPNAQDVAMLLLGNGDGTFQDPIGFASDTTIFAGALALGDFNGDGKLDAALIDLYSGAVQVYSGGATAGSFTANPSVPIDTTAGYIYCARAADFNQDGKTDLAVVEYSNTGDGMSPGAVLLLTSTGTGFTTASQAFAADTSSLSVAVSDVNGDGFPDVTVADPGVGGAPDTGQILVFENNGSGALNAVYPYPAAGVSEVAGIPFPVIGKPAGTAAIAPSWSLVYSTVDATSGAVTVTALRRQSANSYTTAYTIPTGAFAGTGDNQVAVAVAAGDFNGDGYLDLAAFGTNGNAQNAILPFGYGNDSSASIASSTQQPNAGTYNLTASYPGNLLFASATSPNAQVIISPATPGGTVSGPGTADYGQSVTFTASVAGVPGGTVPSGTVQFLDNGTALGAPQTLVSGAAQLSTASLAAGAHTITAAYTGDINYAPLTSLGSARIAVSQASVSLTLTSSAASTTAGTVVAFTVQAVGSQLPVGDTVYFNGLPTPGLATIDTSGRAVYRFGLLTPGTYTIEAQYGGSGTFAAATSNQVTLQVAPTPVTVTLASSANPVTNPAPIALTATVVSGGLGVPTGTLTFENNGQSLASGALQSVNGTSGLSSAGTFGSTGNGDLAVATGDFNHDGHMDMAVLEAVSDGPRTLEILLGNGDGTFQAPVSYGPSAGIDSGSFSMTAGDFNADGYTDLAIASENGLVTVLLAKGDSNGDLQVSQTIDGTPQGTAIATGDFNKDGSLDLAVAGGANLYVYFGSGSGSFSATPDYRYVNEGANLTGVTAADLNQDGYADIAASDAAGPDVTVLLYNPSGRSFTTTSYPTQTSADGIVAGDFNGDKYPDLAVMTREGSIVNVLLNSAGAFTNATAYGIVATPTSLAAADFNGDGYADLVVTGTRGDFGGGTAILLGSRSGAMTSEASLPTVNGDALAAADLNGDGHPDLLVGASGVSVFLDSDSQLSAGNIVLPVGTAPLTAVYGGSRLFASATSNTVNEVVNPAPPALALSGISPASAQLGDPATTVTLTGAGFTAASQVLLNGSAIPTTYVGATQLQAVIPAASLQQTGVLTLAVSDSGVTTSAVPFSVLAPPLQVTLTGPGTEQPGQQPKLNFTLQQAYPVPIQGTFTLTVQPLTEGGPVDPAVQFATGGTTFNFTLPANSTDTPPIQLQTGTVAATITVTLTLHAGGTDVTPANLQPVVINVPPAAPTISSVTLARDGNTLTVTVQGFSSTREIKNATFTFTPASGATIQSPQVVVDVNSAFATWYAEDTSVQFGSAFSYVQTFTLSTDAATVQSVSVALTNGVGNSNTRSAQ